VRRARGALLRRLACLARFVARELVGGACLVRRLAPLARDLAHELSIHDCEAARLARLRRARVRRIVFGRFLSTIFKRHFQSHSLVFHSALSILHLRALLRVFACGESVGARSLTAVSRARKALALLDEGWGGEIARAARGAPRRW